MKIGGTLGEIAINHVAGCKKEKNSQLGPDSPDSRLLPHSGKKGKERRIRIKRERKEETGWRWMKGGRKGGGEKEREREDDRSVDKMGLHFATDDFAIMIYTERLASNSR